MLHLSFLITEVKDARGAHSYVQGKNQGAEKRTGAQDLVDVCVKSGVP